MHNGFNAHDACVGQTKLEQLRTFTTLVIIVTQTAKIDNHTIISNLNYIIRE